MRRKDKRLSEYRKKATVISDAYDTAQMAPWIWELCTDSTSLNAISHARLSQLVSKQSTKCRAKTWGSVPCNDAGLSIKRNTVGEK